MVSYINAHAALDKLRENARDKGVLGPRCMVVGPQDSGKSTLCKILASYGTRAGKGGLINRRPDPFSCLGFLLSCIQIPSNFKLRLHFM